MAPSQVFSVLTPSCLPASRQASAAFKNTLLFNSSQNVKATMRQSNLKHLFTFKLFPFLMRHAGLAQKNVSPKQIPIRSF